MMKAVDPSKWRSAVRRLIALILLGCVTPLWAQSLGEVAAREKKRREGQAKATAGKPVPTFTDDDLKGRTPEESTDKSATAATPANRSPFGSPEGEFGSSPPSGSAESSKRPLAESIRARLLTCQDEVAEARARLKTLESHLANLQPRRFHNMEADRQDLERMIKDAREAVDRGSRRCDDIEDEARRANIPPGWIR